MCTYKCVCTQNNLFSIYFLCFQVEKPKSRMAAKADDEARRCPRPPPLYIYIHNIYVYIYIYMYIKVCVYTK